MGGVGALRAEAESRYHRGDLSGALQAYLQLLARDPDDTETLNDLGTVCFGLGLPSQSCSYYRRAIAADPNHQGARDNLKMVCQAHGLSPQAVVAGPACEVPADSPQDGRLPTGEDYEAEGAVGAAICPVCGGHFRSFLPAGRPNNKKPGRRCPACGSLERHRALWLYLLNRTELLTADLRVLHLSPMPCLQQVLSSMPNLHYITADLNSPKAALKMDVTDILFKDSTFDAVLCVHVLEHVREDRKAIRELFRVLRPGAWAIIQSPVDPDREETFEDRGLALPEDRERLYGQKDHMRVYGRDYEDRLREAGFVVAVDDYVGTLGADAIRRHRLGTALSIRFCVKPGP